jgi:predicted phage tail protein
MQHKILLLDELADKWGKTHIYYDLKTPADAIRLLCINYPDFAEHLATSNKQGIGYKVTQVGEELEASELLLPLGQHDLVITPVIVGSKGAAKIFLGVALVGIGFAVGGGVLGSALAKNIGAIKFAKNLGAFLVLGGVGDMLAPQMPTFDASFDVGRGGFLGGPSAMERGADGQQSYAYRGASNTVGIGKTIPIVYGKALIGGHIISTDIDVVNESDPLMTSFEKPSNSTVRVNGQKITFTQTIKDFDSLRAARVRPSARITKFQGPNANRVGALSGQGDGFQFVLNKLDSAGNNSPNTIGFVNLDSSTEQKILDNLQISRTGDKANDNFNVMITFSGLQDRVGTAASTIIQGYITFAVIIKEPDSESIVLHQQLTVQGTQNYTQAIRYIFEFEPAVVDSATSYDVFVQVVDKGIFKAASDITIKDATKMRIDSVGYDLLGEVKNVE